MKNQIIKAALFDLDGVVVFTDKYHYLAWKKLADENNWKFNEEVNQKLRGIPRLASLEEILKFNNISDIPQDKKEHFANLKNSYYVEMLKDLNEDDIYPGAVDFLKQLKENGVKISLCSSSKNADMVLKSLNLTDLFDAVVSGNDITYAKPNPEVFLKGAKKLDVLPNTCVVFEDARVGIQAAKAAGMRAFGVGNYSETADIADQFIKEYNEIDITAFMECGKKQTLPVCETALIENLYDPKECNHMESLFALGNGYLGMRGTFDERTSNETEGMYINGIFATEPYEHIAYFKGFSKHNEFTVNLSDWRIFETEIDGEVASFDNNNISEHTRKLDFLTGALNRSFIFTTSTGKKAKIESTRLVNRKDVHGAEISYKVTPVNFSGKVTIKSVTVKNTKLKGKINTKTFNETLNEGIYTIEHSVPTTNQFTSVSVTHTTDCECEKSEHISDKEYIYTAVFELNQGQSTTVCKFAAFAGTVDNFDNLSKYTSTLVNQNAKKGFLFFENEQTEFWSEHWKQADITVKGSSSDQQAIRYNLFQLKQQLATVNNCSIGATGLTGPGYSGQVFWDTEMYLMPYYNFTNPSSQKELLMYRYKILDKARARAKEFDTRGAMYAWCSIDGDETSVVFEASVAEYHLNSDIAHAIWRYVDSTDDKEFLYNYGAEIVFETAIFMSLRGKFVPARGGKFCINAVCGPDEYACGVNNNFYTNLNAKRHFEYAVEIAEDMKQNCPETFNLLSEKIGLTESDLNRIKSAAENMYLPYSNEYDIYMQDDSYLYEDPVDMNIIPMNVDLRGLYHPLDLWRLQVSKQADVCLATFLYGDFFSYEQKLRCYNYYEPRCNHGSSLSPAIYSISAAELKLPEAYEFFRLTAFMDINDFKLNTYGGIHIACSGGVWMSVVNGFLGMRHFKDGIHFSPSVPYAWEEYSTNISYKGSVINICVNKKSATFELVSGEKAEFYVNGKKLLLNSKNRIINQACAVI